MNQSPDKLDKALLIGVAVVVILIIAGFVLSLLNLNFFTWNSENREGEENSPVEGSPSLVGKINTFSVQRPNLVVTGNELSKVEIWAVPAGTGVTENQYLLLGQAKLESSSNGAQRWILAIPSNPLLATEIFVRGYDKENKVTDKMSLPYVGATEIYDALWADGEIEPITLRVGDQEKVDNLEIALKAVREDSRCPIDVQCIQAGRVLAELELRLFRSRETITLSSDGAGYVYGGYQIKLIEVLPASKSNQTISPRDYRFTFSITRSS